MTGAYLMVKRDGRMVQVEVEHATVEERERALKLEGTAGLRAWIEMLCATIRRAERR